MFCLLAMTLPKLRHIFGSISSVDLFTFKLNFRGCTLNEDADVYVNWHDITCFFSRLMLRLSEAVEGSRVS